jgi:hypothetical protein
MLNEAEMPIMYWPDAMKTATFIYNWTKDSSGKTPYEKWTGKEPELNHLRVFGCTAYAMIPKEKRKKWDNHGKKLCFLGYGELRKGFRLMDAEGNIQYSRSIRCEEEKPFFKSVEVRTKELKLFIDYDNIPAVEAPEEILITDFEVNVSCLKSPEIWSTLPKPYTNESENSKKESNTAEDLREEEDGISTDSGISQYGTPNENDTVRFREDSEENQCETPSQVPERKRMNLRSDKKINYVDSEAENYTDEDSDFSPTTNYARAFSAIATMSKEPLTYEEAINGVDRIKWKKAMDEEMESIKKNGVWKICNKPQERKAIRSKWVYKVKLGVDGQPTRFKARLVAMGFSQRHGFDYEETFAPVARFKTIRLFLAMTAQLKMVIHQMDVKTAFLNGVLSDVSIYMEQPEGYSNGNSKECCLLLKTLYGLKQSPREWNSTLNEYLLSRGFKRGLEDPCIYIQHDNSSNIALILGVYVDDIFIGCRKAYVSKLFAEKSALCRRFEMEDLGEVNWMLKMKINVDHKAGIVTIAQGHYVRAILERFNMTECKLSSTPVEANNNLTQVTDNSPDFHGEYLEAIGSLMYLMNGTRPDIAYAVGLLSRFSQKPKLKHWNAVLRVFQYLKGTINYGLVYRGGRDGEMYGVTDADFASDEVDRRSTSGYVVMYSGAAIYWSSRKQKLTATSTMESEYIGLSECVREIEYQRKIFNELNIRKTGSTTILCDSKSAISVAENSGKTHDRSKHIAIKYHYVREKIEIGDVKLTYVETDENISDIFTKGLPRKQHEKLRSKLGVHELSSSGSVVE